MLLVPDRSEAAPYYHGYIDQVGTGDIRDLLETQGATALTFLHGISEEKSLHRYAPEKWSIRESLSHINDTERVFSFRAFWFARGFDLPLPSFDQDIGVKHSGADARTWSSHLDEFVTVRDATLSFFLSLPEEAWVRKGIASGNPFSVRALAYITVGHVNHHLKLLRERYLTAE